MPAAGKQARRPAGAKKCRIHADAVFADYQKPRRVSPRTAKQNVNLFCPAACTSDKILSVVQVWNLCAVRAQIMRAASRSLFKREPSPCGSRLRACQKDFFDKLKMPHPCGCGIWEYRLSGTRFRLRQALPRGEPSRNPARTAADASRWR